MFPRLERFIFIRRLGRLREDHNQLIDQRLALLQEAYHDFFKGFRASDWQSFPTFQSLDFRPSFRRYVYALEGQSVSKEDFMGCFEELRRETQQVIHTMRSKMNALLSNSGLDPKLDIATLVFDISRYSCRAPDDLIRSAIDSEDPAKWWHGLRVKETEVRSASRIIELAGLDPKTAGSTGNGVRLHGS